MKLAVSLFCVGSITIFWVLVKWGKCFIVKMRNCSLLSAVVKILLDLCYFNLIWFKYLNLKCWLAVTPSQQGGITRHQTSKHYRQSSHSNTSSPFSWWAADLLWSFLEIVPGIDWLGIFQWRWWAKDEDEQESVNISCWGNYIQPR